MTKVPASEFDHERFESKCSNFGQTLTWTMIKRPFLPLLCLPFHVFSTIDVRASYQIFNLVRFSVAGQSNSFDQPSWQASCSDRPAFTLCKPPVEVHVLTGELWGKKSRDCLWSIMAYSLLLLVQPAAFVEERISHSWRVQQIVDESEVVR